MIEKSLNLGHLAEDFAKLLVDVPGEALPEDTIQLEEGERREVTILFLDIVGYTRLAEQLDPEQLKFVISNTLQVFTNQIKRCGGTVEKYVGDAIMALFGRSEAHEDDSRRAVAAARAILERLEDINSILAQKGINISCRIGVNRGLIVTGQLGEHDTVTGEAINIAQRLEANAPANGILISDSVYAECAPYFECQPLPPLHVKNKTEPVIVYLVSDEKAGSERMMVPQAGTFAGREGERSTLRAVWERAAQGQMGLVQVVGEAGVGKSALLQAVMREVRSDTQRAATIYFKADSFGLTPYHALSDLVREYLAGHITSLEDFIVAIPDPTLREGLGTYRLYLADILGLPLSEDERQRLARMDPRARQAETNLALKRFIEAAVATERARGALPLVIAIDNFQWVTHASREALSQILQTLPRETAVLWLMAGRGGDAAPWVSAQLGATVLQLTPLPFEDAATLIRARFPERVLGDEFCRRLFVRSGGNALFLNELVGELRHDSDLSDVSFAERLPSSIKALVLSRLDRLPRPEKFALQLGALAGREFSEDLLRHVLRRAMYDYDATQLIERLCAANLLARNDHGVTIAQPMLTEVAYSTILYANRRKLHATVAQWVEENRPDISIYAAYLAEQWERAEEYAKAYHYYADAGHSARRRYAQREAATFLEKALKFRSAAGATAEQLAEVYGHLVGAFEALGEPEKWQHALREGLQQAPAGSPMSFRFRLSAIEVEQRYGDRAKAREQLQVFLTDAAVRETPEVHLRALLTASNFANDHGEDDTAFIQPALALRPQIQDVDLQEKLDHSVFNHYKNADELTQAEQYLVRLLDAAQTDFRRHLCDLFYCSFAWDRGVEFEAIIARACAAQNYWREVGWVRGVGWGAFYRGAALWRMSRYTEARQVFIEGVKELERARDQFMLGKLELVLAAIHLFSGDQVNYQVRKSRILTQAQQTSESEWLALRREFAMFEGQCLEPRHTLAGVYEELVATGSAPLAKVQIDEYTVTLALVAVQLGHTVEAEQLIQKVGPHIRDNAKTWLWGLCGRVEALIAAAREEWEPMERAFAESVLRFQKLGAQYDAYLTYRGWWRALKQRGLAQTPTGATVQQALAQLAASVGVAGEGRV